MPKEKLDEKIVSRKAVACALLGLTLLSTTSASGAVITVSTGRDDDRPIINVDGVLITADDDTFRKIAARFHSASAVVSFNSGGGSLVTGIQIGEIIRQQHFNTIVRDGKSCASACALAWLAGVERSIEGTGRIGFHAAYDATSGRETGVGNALLGAYVAKLGLSYGAVIYITKAAPNKMTWLNISDAAALGIRVAFASPTTRKSILTLPTRYGNIEIVKLANDNSEIQYKSSKLKIFLNENGFANLEAVFRVAAGDLLIISTPSNVRRMPPSYYAILVTPQSAADISGEGFDTAEDTFRFEQVGDEVRFDLGYENRRKKNAIYRNGAITVQLEAQSSSATLPKAECARVLKMVAGCPKIEPGCSEGAIWDNFAMAGQSYFNSLENMPVFSSENFYRTCRQFCRSRTYSLKTARPLLCGY
jgi:hypothetical protein